MLFDEEMKHNYFSDLFKALITASLITQSFYLPQAFSQNSAPKISPQFFQDKAYLEKLNYQFRADHKNAQAIVYDQRTGEKVLEVPYSSTERLRRFSPRSVNSLLKEELKRVTKAGKSAWSQTMKNMPMEASIFFVGMGAIAAAQIFTDFAQYPIALEQHVQHQTSPVGAVALSSFILTQGITSNVVDLYARNTKFAPFVPYLGMTAGFFVSSYLSNVAADPNVQACIKTWMGGKLTAEDKDKGIAEDPCEKAYEHLVLKQKLWEMAPNLVSMLLSTVLSSVAQHAVTTAVLRTTGVNLAVWLVPGSAQVKGFYVFLARGIQFTVFLTFDLWLQQRITYLWKNIMDGKDIQVLRDDLVQSYQDSHGKSWTQSAPSVLTKLKELQKLSSGWRMANMADVYEAHTAWQTNLNQLTGMYNASQLFYSSLLAEVRNARAGKYSHVFLQAPLNGIKPRNLQEGREAILHTNPLLGEELQKETAIEIGRELRERIDSNKNQFKTMLPEEQKFLLKLQASLISSDLEKMAAGMVDFTSMTQKMQRTPHGFSHFFGLEMRQLQNDLGQVKPLLDYGRIFMESYLQVPEHKESVKGLVTPTVSGAIRTETLPDYFFVQMICGPKIQNNEQAVFKVRGFSSHFAPPSVVNFNSSEEELCQSTSRPYSMDHFYRLALNKARGGMGALVTHVDPKIIGQDSEEFNNWWKKHSEAQMIQAFEDFGKHYEEIVMNLLNHLGKNERSMVNRGPYNNGILRALYQEASVYTTILESLILSKAQKSSLEKLGFRRTSTYGMMAQLKYAGALLPGNGITQVQEIADLETELIKFKNLLDRVQVKQVGPTKKISSDLENYELEEQVQAVQEKIGLIAQKLGYAAGQEVEIKVLTEDEKQLATFASEALQSLSTELMMFGTVTNAVSWEKIQGLKKMSEEQDAFLKKAQEQLKKLKGATAPGN